MTSLRVCLQHVLQSPLFFLFCYENMPHCMLPTCTNGSHKTQGSDVSYHRLPKHRHLRKIWINPIRRYNPPKHNSCYVCSEHFTPDCFEHSLKQAFGKKTPRRLKPGSVPSIFPFAPRQSERETSKRRINKFAKTAVRASHSDRLLISFKVCFSSTYFSNIHDIACRSLGSR